MKLLNSLRFTPRILHRTHQLPPKRHGHLVYRAFAPAPRKNQIIAQVILGSMWFWILWRFYHEPEDVFGHFPFPDPSQWTDEELGIPPDDED
ncbi:NADH dehydrogenase [ubiquinone] 1 beta subcomplex subunit 2, mitochondrial [Holothuria leucospilota]|uniref:NADH dehydrogenase [ubiquinone] 1 beta subcomplex subunit 2, mitochondrial n=1 Tax=Holothuria leucospilota TaxID=206669 RepID=A0A9Q1BS94_HOLLE|nr:NADH dehydrogenase [ubiquinone] 1 beta subcomplex subunit 2, mitochondrial [Holothuria leucospilota]